MTVAPGLSRRRFLALAAAGSVPGSSACAQTGDVLTPEMFGAKGDGVANDSDAFNRLSREINKRGGGTIVLRRTTYLVGGQTRSAAKGSEWAFAPAPLIQLAKCREVKITGNGARLRCAAGLRYGTFDPGSGAKTQRAMPNFAQAERATPYSYMVLIEECDGPVLVENLELDGNLSAHILGGGYGDVGRQIPAAGLFLRNNRGSERLRNIYSHHHAQDGLTIDGPDDMRLAAQPREIVDVRAENNGRQGCSLVGGRGYRFRRCRFSGTGKAGIFSPPGAGLDIEAEAPKTIVDIGFAECTFADNAGCGMIADSGPSSAISFTDCIFVGSAGWAAWPKKPRIRFERCTFRGAVVGTFASPVSADATAFSNCRFFDRTSASAKAYIGGKANGPIVDTGGGQNVRFTECLFKLTADGTLPWTIGAIFENCTMAQVSRVEGYPRGRYRGVNRITGAARLDGSTIAGTVILNGKTIARNA